MDYTIRVTKQQQARTPLVLRMFGADHRQEKVNRPAGLPMWQIIYGVSGSGRFEIEGRHYVLGEGTAALLAPHTGHRYESTDGEWTVHFIGFGGSSCQKFLYDLKLCESGVYAQRTGRDETFSGHIRAFERIAAGDDPQKYLLYSKELYAALLDLSLGSTLKAYEDLAEGDPLLAEVIGYLEEHCGGDIPLSSLAEEFHLSPEYLCARFKKGTGETIGSYLKRIRIGRARSILMEQPGLTLGEVGELCGFRSPSYFGRVFREMTGVTPQKYRNPE